MDAPLRCPCPGTPHESDTVTLRDRLDFRSITTIRKAMGLVDTDDEEVRNAQLLATCTEFYMLLGITAWTFVDAKGKPLPVSHAAIREVLFTAEDVEAVSGVAETLYNPVVLLPLLNRASASSPPMPTNGSTSATLTDIRPRRPKPSKRSSTTTTRTVATETTSLSLVGGSSSSPNSVSAA